MLDNLITSKTRLKLLIKFFVSQANKGHLNGLATEMGESTNSIRKELNLLYDAGYLKKNRRNNKVIYNVNIDHPLYNTLRQVVMKHLGLDDIVDTVINKMGNVSKIILVGDYAKGNDSGRIEIFLLGDDLNTDYIKQLAPKIENIIQREVSFHLTSRFNYDQNHIILYENI